MSADNWGQCPKCRHDLLDKAAKAEESAKKSYGKVSADVYESKMEQAREFLAKANESAERTL